MNLSVKLSGLVVTSALFLFSCKKDVNNISLNEKPQLGVFFNDTLEIEADVVLMNDSLQSSSDRDMGNQAMFVGTFKDEKFGEVSAESFVSIIRKSSEEIINPTILSGTISVASIYKYGTTNLSNQAFSVFETNEPIKRQKYFTSHSEAVSFKEPQIGRLVPTNPNLPNGAIKFSSELPLDFCLRLLTETKSEKGIYIAHGDNVGVHKFSANHDSTYIEIKYTLPDKTGELRARFTLGSDSSKFYRITTDFTGSELSKIKIKTPIPASELGNKAFVQAGTGLMMSLRIKGLEDFAEKIGPTALIRAAELVLQFDTTADKLSTKPALALLFRKKGEYFRFGSVNFLHENKLGNTPVAVLPAGNVYRFLLTDYLKSIIKGANPHGDLLVFPIENTNTFTLNRVVFNTNTAQSKPFKLNIYYTK